MRKKISLTVAALLVSGGGLVAWATASPPATAATTLTVIEHGRKAAYSDLAQPGYSRGDLSTFHNQIYDETDTTRVGSDEGLCTVISTKRQSWECVTTIFLENGSSSITLANRFFETEDSVGAVTGGTGTYDGAAGTFTIGCTSGDCSNFEYTLTFEFL